ncbi:MAG: TIGR04282 family arsenosugar biosynthesis glycosyltransferase [Geodermatophilaceae bacterium]
MTRCSDVTVLVVAKAPRPGAVKTRLAADLGEVGAARVAAAALLDTLLVCGTVFDHRVLALAGDLADTGVVDTDDIRREIKTWTVIGQSSGDLGRRLASAHADAHARTSGGRASRILQIGMDTPHVPANLLESSAGLLCQHGVDAVLGPAEDGGWWVCGSSDPAHAAHLANVPMSRPDTGDLTLAALQAAGARVGLVAALRDLDTLDDAKVISAENLGLHVSAELTRQGVG